MIQGIELFKEHFKGYENHYIIIGGFAMLIHLEKIGLTHRSTKDIDMVIVLNEYTNDFLVKFMEFIESGNYQHREKSNGKIQNFRFTHPKDHFPYQIELLTNRDLGLKSQQVFRHFEINNIEDISAIMLDQHYYQLLINNRDVVDGLSIVKVDVLILLKIKAWLNLSADIENGVFVKRYDLNKHSDDVFKIIGALTDKFKNELDKNIQQDILCFCSKLDIEYHDECENLKRYFKL